MYSTIIIYKNYDFQLFCDEYESNNLEIYKNDIDYLNVKNYMAKEKEVSIKPILFWGWENNKKIILSSPNKDDICVSGINSPFGKYIAEQVDRLIQYKNSP